MVETECSLLEKMIGENLNTTGLIWQQLRTEQVHYMLNDGLTDVAGNLALAGGLKTIRALKLLKGKLQPKWIEKQGEKKIKKLKRQLAATIGSDKLARQFKVLQSVTKQGYLYNWLQNWLKREQRKGIKIAQNFIRKQNIFGNQIRRIRNLMIARSWQLELKRANKKYQSLKDPTGLIGRFLKAYTKALVPPTDGFRRNAVWFRQFAKFFCRGK